MFHNRDEIIILILVSVTVDLTDRRGACAPLSAPVHVQDIVTREA